MQTIYQITPKMDVCYLGVDEWTDKVKRNFLGITLQGLINDKFDKKVVCFKKIDAEKVTGEYLQTKIEKKINDYNIQNNFGGIISDGASNMIAAFDNARYKRKCCVCHVLNFLLRDIHDVFSQRLNGLQMVVFKIKNSYDFVKMCEQANISTKKLTSFTPTIWYGLFQTIHCFNHSFEVALDFIAKHKMESPFTCDELELFKEFELFLSYIKDAIKLFEASSFGQSGKIFAEIHMKESLLIMLDNSQFIKKQKDQINEIITNRIAIIEESWGDLIFAVALLHPNKFFPQILSNETKT